jgi:hypothetical protein
MAEERPECCTDEMLEYLDDMRESNDINMFGCGPYLQSEFGIDRREAKAVFFYWKDTFGERHPH